MNFQESLFVKDVLFVHWTFSIFSECHGIYTCDRYQM